jgi:hypothetical protein
MAPSEELKPNTETNTATKPSKRHAWKKPLLIFLILIICAIYPVVKIRWAKNRVKDFCSHISIGMRVQGLEQRAKDYGLKVKTFKGSDSQSPRIIVWEGWAFARWFCEIEHSNGKVVHKKAFSLD